MLKGMEKNLGHIEDNATVFWYEDLLFYWSDDKLYVKPKFFENILFFSKKVVHTLNLCYKLVV